MLILVLIVSVVVAYFVGHGDGVRHCEQAFYRACDKAGIPRPRRTK